MYHMFTTLIIYSYYQFFYRGYGPRKFFRPHASQFLKLLAKQFSQATWLGIQAVVNFFIFFTEISCPKVPRGHEKLTTLTSNRNCFEKSLKVDEKCEFACSSKYQLTGAKVLTCMKDKGAVGRWEAATGSKTPNCSGRALNIC